MQYDTTHAVFGVRAIGGSQYPSQKGSEVLPARGRLHTGGLNPNTKAYIHNYQHQHHFEVHLKYLVIQL